MGDGFETMPETLQAFEARFDPRRVRELAACLRLGARAPHECLSGHERRLLFARLLLEQPTVRHDATAEADPIGAGHRPDDRACGAATPDAEAEIRSLTVQVAALADRNRWYGSTIETLKQHLADRDRRLALVGVVLQTHAIATRRASEELRLARDEIAELERRLADHARHLTLRAADSRDSLRMRHELGQARAESERLREQIRALESGPVARTVPAIEAPAIPTANTRMPRRTAFGLRIDSWAETHRKGGRFALPQRIVVCGRVPRAARDIEQLIRRNGAAVAAVGDRLAPAMVLGREGWYIDDIEAQIRARSGDTLHIYSQEMFLLALEVGADPFATADESTLRQFADGHAALECCIQEGFLWPSLSTSAVARELDVAVHQVEQSPLHRLGYRVGRTHGLECSDRREILQSAFRGRVPFVASDEYMRAWGSPGSRRRLRKMARLLAWQAEGARGRGDDMTVAIRHWKGDLKWLKDQFYEPWMRFRWPKFRIPAHDE